MMSSQESQCFLRPPHPTERPPVPPPLGKRRISHGRAVRLRTRLTGLLLEHEPASCQAPISRRGVSRGMLLMQPRALETRYASRILQPETSLCEKALRFTRLFSSL